MTHFQLKERKEAYEFADDEFRRVKRAKLETERANSRSSPEGMTEDKQTGREQANRASAAASRAKIICYSKELEKRTDRLEVERNEERKRADRAMRKLKMLRNEVHMLKRVLREIWDMKEHRTCTYLVDSDVMFLLSSRQEDSIGSLTESDEEKPKVIFGITSDANLHCSAEPDASLRASDSSHLQPICCRAAQDPKSRRDELPSQSQIESQATTVPRAQQSAALRNLVHPSTSNGLRNPDSRLLV